MNKINCNLWPHRCKRWIVFYK